MRTAGVEMMVEKGRWTDLWRQGMPERSAEKYISSALIDFQLIVL